MGADKLGGESEEFIGAASAQGGLGGDDGKYSLCTRRRGEARNAFSIVRCLGQAFGALSRGNLYDWRKAESKHGD